MHGLVLVDKDQHVLRNSIIWCDSRAVETGKGKEFEEGKLSLEDLRNFAMKNGEPAVKSGKQEYLENIINNYI